MAFTRATGKHRRPGRIERTHRPRGGRRGPRHHRRRRHPGRPGARRRARRRADRPHPGHHHRRHRSPSRSTPRPPPSGRPPRRPPPGSRPQEAARKRRRRERPRRQREAKERAAREAERKRLNSFVAPISGSYVSTGYKTGGAVWSSGSHTGVDFHAASGTAVHAVGAGTVVEAGWGGSYGNKIVIKMNDGTYTQYGHLSSIGVSVGQTVTPGQQIGLSGATGNVTGPHLHFEARTSPEYGSDMDPVAYLRSHGVNV